MFNLKIVFILCISLLFSPLSSYGEGFHLKVVSSKDKQAIEGAVIYDKKLRTAYRSNRNGEVEISADFNELQIKAKYHTPIIINKDSLTSKSIVMQHSKQLLANDQALKHSKKNIQWGTYGPLRANNDLLNYDLTLRVDPEQKHIVGNNKIRFKMLKDGKKIQIDLVENFTIEKILHNNQPLTYRRELNAVIINFEQTLAKDSIQEIDFHYSGKPMATGRFGCFTFKKDDLGKHWINTACQGSGSMVWWPNKDQQPDEVEGMIMRISVPSDLKNISNGRLIATNVLDDGFTEYVWQTFNPINNYSVSLNIGNYVHFGENLGELTLDYYVLEQDLAKAKQQFKQAKPMMVSYQKYFGEYPFIEDGYKLIQAPYSGMEHQSAVTYGNGFTNGYLARDWTGVGISLKFDFIIIHETGHEWFGNSLTSNDFSDSWIHEGWCTYAEAVYVEDQFGYSDAIKYINGYKDKVANTHPMIGPSSVSHWPTSDIYFKGSLFINTLRHVINDDEKWWAGVKAYTTQFKKKNFYTVDVLNFFNQYFDYDFEKIFDQYLYFNELPNLQISQTAQGVKYRWQSDVVDFDMPIIAILNNKEVQLQPNNKWQLLSGVSELEQLIIAKDKFYIDSEILERVR